MKTNQERTMKNIFADNAEVNTLLANIRANAIASHSAGSDQDYVTYWTLGALKAELHMLAQRFPEVEAYLAERNASQAKKVA
jgi:hypothetical protein